LLCLLLHKFELFLHWLPFHCQQDLLALGESIGTVNIGLAEDKISSCVREVVCCSSDESQNDEDDGTCVVCLVRSIVLLNC
jgi:hypothetical protein